MNQNTQNESVIHPRDLLPKPSDALTAMIDGLRSVANRPGFAVDMQTYGTKRNGICFGCAATFTTLTTLEKQQCEVPIDDWQRRFMFQGKWYLFEQHINRLRKGGQYGAASLLQYYEVFDESLMPRQSLPLLDNDTWQGNLEPFEAYRDQLKAAGF